MLKSLGPSAKISTQVVFIQKCELSEMSGGYGVASREKKRKAVADWGGNAPGDRQRAGKSSRCVRRIEWAKRLSS